MWLNWALFRGRGYVTRPAYIGNEAPLTASGAAKLGGRKSAVSASAEKFPRPPSQFTQVSVTVLGARYLMQPRKRNTVDPFVQVQLWDGSPRVVKFRTDAVRATANPDYRVEPFQLPVVDSHNSFLSVAVYSSDELIGFWCAHLHDVRAGTRCVHLRDANYGRVNKGQAHVLVHIALTKSD